MKIYHFLGSVYFALVLIACTALFVIAGTFLESAHQSHLYAEAAIYNSPLFALLLWGFFINILFAATRRWPFRLKHIPFLITHLGLLMVLGGVLVKHYTGVQGHLLLIEGGGSHAVQIPNSYAVSVSSREDGSTVRYPLKRKMSGGFDSLIARRGDGLVLRLAEFNPHSSEHLATWVKGSDAAIGTLHPMPLVNNEKGQYAVGGRVRFGDDQSPVWDLYAVQTENLDNTLKELQLKKYKKPLAAVIEDTAGDTHLAAYDPNGREWQAVFKKGVVDMVVAYDDGYGGYTVRADIPFDGTVDDKAVRDKAVLSQMHSQLKAAEKQNREMAPPMLLFQDACTKTKADFAASFTEFLTLWNDGGQWIYPESSPLPDNLKPVFTNLMWGQDPLKIGCEWTVSLFEKIGPELNSGKAPVDVLADARWPLLSSLKDQTNDLDDPNTILSLVTQQVFYAAALQGSHNSATSTSSPEHEAALFSALLRLYGIHPDTIPLNSPGAAPVPLETAIAPYHEALPPGTKLEDNIPRVVIHASKGMLGRSVSLRYDRNGTGLKWPALNGQYLLRFQPDIVEIPYHLRLRQARQINYPNSSQPYSYESDLIITDRRSGAAVEQTISMNRVHETWDGYRFYLSSISPSDESAAKHILIVVNRDPAKYWLTYPGAFVLSCGILLLFALRPYKPRGKDES